MSASNRVRFAPPTNSGNNPTNLALDIKPSRILVGVGAPSLTTGTFLDYYIDNATGNFYMKSTSGDWGTPIYNFAVAPDSGITDLANLGSGARIYVPPVVAGIASLRTLVSNTGKITFLEEPNDVSLGVNINKTDVALGFVQNVLNNYSATMAPTVNNDQTQNYVIGSIWWDYTDQQLYICQSNSTGAAVWVQVTTTPNSGFLTTCANAGSGAGLFRDVTGTTANFKSLTSSNASIFFSPQANTIDCIALNPVGLFKDFANFGFDALTTTALSSTGVNIPLNQPWNYNSSYSRGSWSLVGTFPQLNIQRNVSTTAGPIYHYQVIVVLNYQSNNVTLVGQSRIIFGLQAVTGNCSFPPQSNNTANGWVGPANSHSITTTLSTILRVTDNNPCSFYLFAVTDTIQNITSFNTQLTITQI